MIRILLTGDIHIGKKYDRYPEAKDVLTAARLECVDRIVKKAEDERCDLIVITGDTFDNTSKIRGGDVLGVVKALSAFGGRVLMIPGNHDYYTGEESVWRDFEAALPAFGGNIVLMTEFRPYSFDIGEESLTVYPAFCQSKHSHTNNLGWIRELPPDGADYHIGIAHGSVEGVSPDDKKEYFPMTEEELLSIPADAWFIGHTHVPYPRELREDKEVTGYRIYNAGTPQQPDLSTNTDGRCFIVSLDKKASGTEVSARSLPVGDIRFFDLKADTAGRSLREVLSEALSGIPDRSVIRLTLSGALSREDHAQRKAIAAEEMGRFITYEVDDRDLCEVITKERIRSEFPEIGFAAAFLEAIGDPRELQMAYGLVGRHRDAGQGGRIEDQ